MPSIEDVLCDYHRWYKDREALAEREDSPSESVDSDEWADSDDTAVTILQAAASALEQAKADRDVLDDISVGLGTRAEWGADEL